MSRKSVLVAGGAGFIGSHLCEALIADEWTVVCLDNLQTGTSTNLDLFASEPRFDFIEHDVVRPLPASLRPDAIFNLACPASPPHYQADPVHTMLTSVVGTHNLLALAADRSARFVLASTSEVYGDPQVHPQPESYFGNVNATGPRACYDEGKRAAESLTFDYCRTRRLDCRVARIFNTYGPRMRPDDGRVISNVVCQALADEPITIYGDGSQTRSFCYVSDLVSGLVRLMGVENDGGGPVNLGNPAEMTIRELVAEVVALTGTGSPIVRRPLPTDDPKRRRPDIARASAWLGWAPSVSLAEGLPQTVDWFARAAKPTARKAEPKRRRRSVRPGVGAIQAA